MATAIVRKFLADACFCAARRLDDVVQWLFTQSGRLDEPVRPSDSEPKAEGMSVYDVALTEQARALRVDGFHIQKAKSSVDEPKLEGSLEERALKRW